MKKQIKKLFIHDKTTKHGKILYYWDQRRKHCQRTAWLFQEARYKHLGAGATFSGPIFVPAGADFLECLVHCEKAFLIVGCYYNDT